MSEAIYTHDALVISHCGRTWSVTLVGAGASRHKHIADFQTRDEAHEFAIHVAAVRCDTAVVFEGGTIIDKGRL